MDAFRTGFKEKALMLLARDLIDVIVGSCGTGGRDAGVDWMAEIIREAWRWCKY
jgi:cysteine synthase